MLALLGVENFMAAVCWLKAGAAAPNWAPCPLQHKTMDVSIALTYLSTPM
jgi:hypothetical protein